MYLIFICVLILFSCCSCVNTQFELEKKDSAAMSYDDTLASTKNDAVGYEQRDNNTNTIKFPPDDVELLRIFDEAGINWIITRSTTMNDNVAIHLITDSTEFAVVGLNLYATQPEDKKCIASFGFGRFTPEDYHRWEVEEWPAFWLLAGKLFNAPDKVSSMGAECMSYFANLNENEPGYLEWRGRQEDIHCSVSFMWHPMLEIYVLESIVLSNPQSYELVIKEAARFRSQEVTTVLELKSIGISLDELYSEPLLVKGRMEQLDLTEGDFEINTSKTPLPNNTNLYLSAMLVDETGSIPVYLTPTSLNESELSEELWHYVTIIKTTEPYYIVDLSMNSLH